MSGIVERRRHPRVVTKGTMVAVLGGHSIRGRLVNLSVGGVLATTLVTAPNRLLARNVEVELRLDDASASWLQVPGIVSRIGAEHVAVRFPQAPAALVRAIDDIVAASYVRSRVLNVVLIDGSIERRSLIATAFQAVGCTLVEAQTPLEAIVRLGESSFEPDVIAVGDTVQAAEAVDMREFVARNHPHVRLIAVTDALLETGDKHSLSSGTTLDELTQRIRALLAQPPRGALRL